MDSRAGSARSTARSWSARSLSEVNRRSKRPAATGSRTCAMPALRRLRRTSVSGGVDPGPSIQPARLKPCDRALIVSAGTACISSGHAAAGCDPASTIAPRNASPVASHPPYCRIVLRQPFAIEISRETIYWSFAPGFYCAGFGLLLDRQPRPLRGSRICHRRVHLVDDESHPGVAKSGQSGFGAADACQICCAVSYHKNREIGMSRNRRYVLLLPERRRVDDDQIKFRSHVPRNCRGLSVPTATKKQVEGTGGRQDAPAI